MVCVFHVLYIEVRCMKNRLSKYFSREDEGEYRYIETPVPEPTPPAMDGTRCPTEVEVYGEERAEVTPSPKELHRVQRHRGSGRVHKRGIVRRQKREALVAQYTASQRRQFKERVAMDRALSKAQANILINSKDAQTPEAPANEAVCILTDVTSMSVDIQTDVAQVSVGTETIVPEVKSSTPTTKTTASNTSQAAIGTKINEESSAVKTNQPVPDTMSTQVLPTKKQVTVGTQVDFVPIQSDMGKKEAPKMASLATQMPLPVKTVECGVGPDEPIFNTVIKASTPSNVKGKVDIAPEATKTTVPAVEVGGNVAVAAPVIEVGENVEVAPAIEVNGNVTVATPAVEAVENMAVAAPVVEVGGNAPITLTAVEVGGNVTIPTPALEVSGNVEVAPDIEVDENVAVAAPVVEVSENVAVGGPAAEVNGNVPVKTSAVEVGGNVPVTSGTIEVSGKVAGKIPVEEVSKERGNVENEDSAIIEYKTSTKGPMVLNAADSGEILSGAIGGSSIMDVEEDDITFIAARSMFKTNKAKEAMDLSLRACMSDDSLDDIMNAHPKTRPIDDAERILNIYENLVAEAEHEDEMEERRRLRKENRNRIEDLQLAEARQKAEEAGYESCCSAGSLINVNVDYLKTQVPVQEAGNEAPDEEDEVDEEIEEDTVMDDLIVDDTPALLVAKVLSTASSEEDLSGEGAIGGSIDMSQDITFMAAKSSFDAEKARATMGLSLRACKSDGHLDVFMEECKTHPVKDARRLFEIYKDLVAADDEDDVKEEELFAMDNIPCATVVDDSTANMEIAEIIYKAKKAKYESLRASVEEIQIDASKKVEDIIPAVEVGGNVAIAPPAVEVGGNVAAAAPAVEVGGNVAAAAPAVEVGGNMAVAAPAVEVGGNMAVAAPAIEVRGNVAVATPAVEVGGNVAAAAPAIEVGGNVANPTKVDTVPAVEVSKDEPIADSGADNGAVGGIPKDGLQKQDIPDDENGAGEHILDKINPDVETNMEPEAAHMKSGDIDEPDTAIEQAIKVSSTEDITKALSEEEDAVGVNFSNYEDATFMAAKSIFQAEKAAEAKNDSLKVCKSQDDLDVFKTLPIKDSDRLSEIYHNLAADTSDGNEVEDMKNFVEEAGSPVLAAIDNSIANQYKAEALSQAKRSKYESLCAAQCVKVGDNQTQAAAISVIKSEAEVQEVIIHSPVSSQSPMEEGVTQSPVEEVAIQTLGKRVMSHATVEEIKIQTPLEAVKIPINSLPDKHIVGNKRGNVENEDSAIIAYKTHTRGPAVKVLSAADTGENLSEDYGKTQVSDEDMTVQKSVQETRTEAPVEEDEAIEAVDDLIIDDTPAVLPVVAKFLSAVSSAEALSGDEGAVDDLIIDDTPALLPVVAKFLNAASSAEALSGDDGAFGGSINTIEDVTFRAAKSYFPAEKDAVKMISSEEIKGKSDNHIAAAIEDGKTNDTTSNDVENNITGKVPENEDSICKKVSSENIDSKFEDNIFGGIENHETNDVTCSSKIENKIYERLEDKARSIKVMPTKDSGIEMAVEEKEVPLIKVYEKDTPDEDDDADSKSEDNYSCESDIEDPPPKPTFETAKLEISLSRVEAMKARFQSKFSRTELIKANIAAAPKVDSMLLSSDESDAESEALHMNVDADNNFTFYDSAYQDAAKKAIASEGCDITDNGCNRDNNSAQDIPDETSMEVVTTSINMEDKSDGASGKEETISSMRANNVSNVDINVEIAKAFGWTEKMNNDCPGTFKTAEASTEKGVLATEDIPVNTCATIEKAFRENLLKKAVCQSYQNESSIIPGKEKNHPNIANEVRESVLAYSSVEFDTDEDFTDVALSYKKPAHLPVIKDVFDSMPNVQTNMMPKSEDQACVIPSCDDDAEIIAPITNKAEDGTPLEDFIANPGHLGISLPDVPADVLNDVLSDLLTTDVLFGACDEQLMSTKTHAASGKDGGNEEVNTPTEVDISSVPSNTNTEAEAGLNLGKGITPADMAAEDIIDEVVDPGALGISLPDVPTDVLNDVLSDLLTTDVLCGACEEQLMSTNTHAASGKDGGNEEVVTCSEVDISSAPSNTNTEADVLEVDGIIPKPVTPGDMTAHSTTTGSIDATPADTAEQNLGKGNNPTDMVAEDIIDEVVDPGALGIALVDVPDDVLNDVLRDLLTHDVLFGACEEQLMSTNTHAANGKDGGNEEVVTPRKVDISSAPSNTNTEADVLEVDGIISKPVTPGDMTAHSTTTGSIDATPADTAGQIPDKGIDPADMVAEDIIDEVVDSGALGIALADVPDDVLNDVLSDLLTHDVLCGACEEQLMCTNTHAASGKDGGNEDVLVPTKVDISSVPSNTNTEAEAIELDGIVSKPVTPGDMTAQSSTTGIIDATPANIGGLNLGKGITPADMVAEGIIGEVVNPGALGIAFADIPEDVLNDVLSDLLTHDVLFGASEEQLMSTNSSAARGKDGDNEEVVTPTKVDISSAPSNTNTEADVLEVDGIISKPVTPGDMTAQSTTTGSIDATPADTAGQIPGKGIGPADMVAEDIIDEVLDDVLANDIVFDVLEEALNAAEAEEAKSKEIQHPKVDIGIDPSNTNTEAEVLEVDGIIPKPVTPDDMTAQSTTTGIIDATPIDIAGQNLGKGISPADMVAEDIIGEVLDDVLANDIVFDVLEEALNAAEVEEAKSKEIQPPKVDIVGIDPSNTNTEAEVLDVDGIIHKPVIPGDITALSTTTGIIDATPADTAGLNLGKSIDPADMVAEDIIGEVLDDVLANDIIFDVLEEAFNAAEVDEAKSTEIQHPKTEAAFSINDSCKAIMDGIIKTEAESVITEIYKAAATAESVGSKIEDEIPMDYEELKLIEEYSNSNNAMAEGNEASDATSYSDMDIVRADCEQEILMDTEEFEGVANDADTYACDQKAHCSTYNDMGVSLDVGGNEDDMEDVYYYHEEGLRASFSIIMEEDEDLTLPLSGDQETDVSDTVTNRATRNEVIPNLHFILQNGALKSMGRGAYGTVYKGYYHGDEVAVKVTAMRAMCTLQESQVYHELEWHPCVAEMLANYTVENIIEGIVLEAAKGSATNLVTQIRDSRVSSSIPTADTVLDAFYTVYFTSAISQAITHLHDAGIVHTDINPSNVLIMASGIPKLCDFSSAAFLQPDQGDLSLYPVGTEGFQGPEIITESGYNMNADWFSFGAMLVYVSLGRLPWGTCQMRQMEMLERGLVEQLLIDTELFHQHILGLILTLLQPNPEDRMTYGTKELLAAFDDHEVSRDLQTPPDTPTLEFIQTQFSC